MRNSKQSPLYGITPLLCVIASARLSGNQESTHIMSMERVRNRQAITAKTCAYCGGVTQAHGYEYLSVSCQLSTREQQIVRLIRQAKSNKEIAHELRLTVGTVKEYVYRIFRKLGVANRTELALWGTVTSNLQ